MDENEQEKSTTSPPDPTHDATTPPGQGDRDESATEQSEDKLDQAGGGH
jgi:hypothetical protein